MSPDTPGPSVARPHEHLIEDRRDHVAVLRVDRDKALGALSGSMVEALGDYLTDLAADEDVRVLVITGTGRGFIAGADIGEYVDASRTSFDAYQRASRTVFDRLESLPQPTITAVNGYALGGGFELALCCDLRIASSAARFGLPEVRLGLTPGGGGTVRLARLAGASFTKQLLWTGRAVRPDEAQVLGVVSEVVEPADLLPKALGLAETIAGQAPVAVREAKRLVDGGLGADKDTALTREQDSLSWIYTTEDAREGIAAFAQKRQPGFRGC